MKLWTIQPAGALEQIEKNRYFRCDPSLSYNLTKADSLSNPYHWLAEQMRKKIGDPPQGVEYPVWAWHTWNFERRCPDPESPAFLRRTEPRILFTLDVPDEKVVLTDFDAWQNVMLGGYTSVAANAEEFARDEALLDELEGDALEKAIRASWTNVFIIDPVRNEYLVRGRYIQATFWEIRKEYVVSTQLLPVNG